MDEDLDKLMLRVNPVTQSSWIWVNLTLGERQPAASGVFGPLITYSVSSPDGFAVLWIQLLLKAPVGAR